MMMAMIPMALAECGFLVLVCCQPMASPLAVSMSVHAKTRSVTFILKRVHKFWMTDSTGLAKPDGPLGTRHPGVNPLRDPDGRHGSSMW